VNQQRVSDFRICRSKARTPGADAGRFRVAMVDARPAWHAALAKKFS
jgi:hypothetical protein